MFKEEYKKQYDQLHPSKELIEKTRQRAIASYEECRKDPEAQKKMEEEWKEEECAEKRTGRWIRIAGGMAAGVAIAVIGVSAYGNLKQEQPSASTYDVAEVVPTLTFDIENGEDEKNEEESKIDEKQEQQSKGEVKVSLNANQLEKMASMGRSGGVTLDYASSEKAVFHGNFGVIVYSMSRQCVLTYIPASEMQYAGIPMSCVKVNTDGNRILLYHTMEEDATALVYDVSEETLKSIRLEEEWKESFFAGVQSSPGTEADLYIASSAGGQMVHLGEGRYLQLFYQAPASSLQASLGISIVDVNVPQETIYSVFGDMGVNLVAGEGLHYGNYHNEKGDNLFQPDTEVVESTPSVEETKEPIPEETEVPEETPVVQATEKVEETPGVEEE